MLLSILRYLRGYLSIRVEGYSTERFLNACSHRNIYLWNLKSVRGAYEMNITIGGFRKLKPVLRKTGTKVSITGRYGLPFFLHRYRKRKLFFAGAFLCLALIYGMSLFIWEIDVRGNLSRTDETILAFLEEQDVRHGMMAGKVDCEQIVKDIRREYNDIIWVSASIEGTKLIVQIKENEDGAESEVRRAGDTSANKEEAAEEGTDIIADRDCVVKSIVTRNGVPLVKIGDKVKKGDILVSGRLEVKNDAQEVAGYRYHQSDADIVGEYDITYERSMDHTYRAKDYEKDKGRIRRQKEYYVRAGGRIFAFGSIKNKFPRTESMTKEWQIRIGEHFTLPFSVGVRQETPYQSEEIPYTKEEEQEILTRAFEKDCGAYEKKGLEIMKNNVKIYREQTKASARGALTVQGPVGAEQKTEVLKVPEKDVEERNNDSWE